MERIICDYKESSIQRGWIKLTEIVLVLTTLNESYNSNNDWILWLLSNQTKYIEQIRDD